MKQAKHFRSFMSILLVAAMLLSMTVVGLTGVFASDDGPTLTYSFRYDNAGYAEGRVRLTASSELDYDKYTLYWADDTQALEGYAPITTLNLSQQSRSFTFGEHTAIPAGATKLIAVESALAVAPVKVSMADAVYDIPAEKQFKYDASEKEYTFQTLSDIHFHRDGYEAYQYADEHFTSALNAAQLRGAEFVTTCGDNTNYGDVKEWGEYLNTIANSNYTGPVYEVNGNHEPYNEALGTAAHKNILNQYKIATGLDTVTGKMRSELYYEVTAQNGDHHIFMALELVNKDNSPKISDNFTEEQINWLEGLLNKYKNDGKKIFIYEHAPFTGYGAGDNKINPHYTAAMTIDEATYPQTYRFKELLEANKDIVWFSGHTHIDFKYNYNFDNENGTTAYTVHVPSTASTTTVNAANNGLLYEAKADSAQGYFVDVYADATVVNGTDLVKNEILPLYTYLVDYSGEELIENEVEGGEEVNYSKVVVTVDASVFDAKSVKVMLYGADDETLTKAVTMTKDTDGLYKANVSTQFTKMKFSVATDKFTISSAEYAVADAKVVLGAYKIAYNNSNNWANVNVYAWNTAGGELATWPGVAMNKETDGTYTAVIPDFPNMIIFNNGTGQTDDLDIAPYITETIKGSYTVNSTPTPPVEETTTEYVPPVPVETIRIYLNKPAEWADALIYGFYGVEGGTATGEPLGAYPGTKMTKAEGNVYYYDVPADIDYIKFVDGSTTNRRTNNFSDTKFSDNVIFTLTSIGSNKWDGTATAYTAKSVAAVGAGTTVYAINSTKWADVCAYVWDTDPAVAWPGEAMEKTGETVNGFDVYSYTFDSGYINILFNNKNNGSQTENLTVKNGQYYDIKGKAWYTSLEDVPEVDKTATDVYLAGEFNGWSTTANEFKLVEGGGTKAELKLTLEAGDYEFKVVRFDGKWTSAKEVTTITESVEGLTLSSSVEGNMVLKATVSGEYTFTWDDSKFAVTYPSAEEVEPDYITVYFTNSKAWENITISAYKGADTVCSDAKMNYVETNDNGEDIYSYKIPADTDKIIFKGAQGTTVYSLNPITNKDTIKNNVGFIPNAKLFGTTWSYTSYTYVPTVNPDVTTTEELDVTTTKTESTTTKVEPTTTTAETTTTIVEPATVTVYFSDNKGWENVYIYGFYGVEGGTATGEPLGAYPGTKMTLVGETEMGENEYCAVVPADIDYIKFADGTTDNNRTNNIPKTLIAENAGFYLTDNLGGTKWDYGTYTHVNKGDDDKTTTTKTEPITTTVVTTTNTVEPTTTKVEPTTTKAEPTTTKEVVTTKPVQEPVTVQILLGDADQNGAVNVKDATLIQKTIASLATLSDNGKIAANVDSNDAVNIKDATAIQKHVACIKTGFAINEYIEVETTTTKEDDVKPTTTTKEEETKPTTTVTQKPEPQPGELTKVLGTVKNTLATDFYYSSYVAYANLKKVYFEYKDAKVAESEQATAVAELNAALADFNTMKKNNPSHINYQAPKAGSYLIRGTMNNWDESGVMETDGNGVSITYTLAAGEHKFKIYDVSSGEWYGNTGSFTDSCSGWTFTTGGGEEKNCALNATGGTYKFTVVFENSKVKVSVSKIG